MSIHFQAHLRINIDAGWISLIPVLCAVVEHVLL